MAISLAWLYLLAAGLAEIGFALSIKNTDGFTRIAPSMLTLIFVVASLWLLAQALQTLPISMAYAVWTGTGVIGTTTVGIIWLGEPAGILRISFLTMIFGGIVGLKMN